MLQELMIIIAMLCQSHVSDESQKECQKYYANCVTKSPIVDVKFKEETYGQALMSCTMRRQ